MRIAIVLANCKGNLGDFAILDGMIAYFQKKYQVDEFDIYLDPVVKYSSYYCNKYQQNTAGKVIIKRGVPKHEIKVWYNSFQRLGQRLNLWKYVTERQIIRHSHRIIKLDRLNDFEKYDLLAIAGGGLWGANSVTKFGFMHGLHLNGKKIVCFPFTAAWPMWIANTPNTINQAFATLSHPPYVRESLTKSRFHKIGIEAQEYPDIAFSLMPWVKNIKPRNINGGKKVLLSITNRSSMPKRYEGKLAKSHKNNTKNDKIISSVVKNLVVRNFNIDLISSCPVEDQSWMDQLFKTNNYVNIILPDTWQYFCAEIKTSECLITNRLHGAILGLLSDTPILLITDSDKTLGFAESFPQIRKVKMLKDIKPEIIDNIRKDRNTIVKNQQTLVNQCYKKIMTMDI